MGRLAWVLLAAAPCAFAAPPSGQDRSSTSDSGFSVKLGYDYTEGKYTSRQETIVSTESATLTYDTDDWSADVMVPYLQQRGPGRLIFLPGRRPVIVIGPAQKAKGIGDVTAGYTRYVLDEDKDGFDLDLGGIVKFGTGSAKKGLGTGKNDFSAQAAASKSFTDLTATLTGGYTVVGKYGGAELRNTAYGSADFVYKASERLSYGFTYNYAQAALKSTSESRDVTAYVDLKAGKRARLELYYVRGFSTESPDRGGGLTVACDF